MVETGFEDLNDSPGGEGVLLRLSFLGLILTKPKEQKLGCQNPLGLKGAGLYRVLEELGGEWIEMRFELVGGRERGKEDSESCTP